MAATYRRPPPEALETVPTIELLTELKRRHGVLSRPPSRLALLGPPCVGKWTQAANIRRAYGLCQISAADVAAASSSGTRRRGSSDDNTVATMMELLERPQCSRGFVLEGLPATVAQAEKLQDALTKRGAPLHGALFLDAPDEMLLERCQGELLHEATGRQYHEQHKPPLEEGLDDFSGDKLIRSPFDEKTVKQDIEKHNESCRPLEAFFESLGIARKVSAAGSIEEVGSACVKEVVQTR